MSTIWVHPRRRASCSAAWNSCRTESALTLRLLHPELAQLTRAAPRVSADPRHDAIALAHKEGEQLAVGDVSGPRVELVDPIFQVLHFVWRRVDWSQRDLAHALASCHLRPMIVVGRCS